MSEEGNLTKVAEASIFASVPSEGIDSVLNTALGCLEEDHHKRPLMSDVVHELTSHQSDVAVDIVNELKDQQLLYRNLVHTPTSATPTQKSREFRSLFGSMSSTSIDTEVPLEMTLSSPR
ncbi:hypothetical protein R1flu_003329 [Riccia fluitans]|uniref:Uncharacterized protein n=1 Tax=Riccia fluitans TaxID=41844 RepID=A0ABD1Y9N4_9MARC